MTNNGLRISAFALIFIKDKTPPRQGAFLLGNFSKEEFTYHSSKAIAKINPGTTTHIKHQADAI